MCRTAHSLPEVCPGSEGLAGPGPSGGTATPVPAKAPRMRRARQADQEILSGLAGGQRSWQVVAHDGPERHVGTTPTLKPSSIPPLHRPPARIA